MSNEPDKLTRLDAVMATVWDVVDGVPADLTGLQIDVNELTPSEESPWEFEFGYAENAVSAVAYAVSTCSSGDPQDAVWAGRQVYEVAEYAARKGEEGIEIASTGEYQVALKGHIIQGSLALLESLLGEVERAEFTSDMLRSRVVAEGCDWVNRLP